MHISLWKKMKKYYMKIMTGLEMGEKYKEKIHICLRKKEDFG
jgi:hypothetical protein